MMKNNNHKDDDVGDMINNHAAEPISAAQVSCFQTGFF